ncbi:methyltransferase [Pseudarthrobacter sp. NPDC058329]|uniref:methyltransferase n=1 Tax=Pseudarthrobacter sp. NPDC058329 TaxID=3346448 RepID=UPI0036DA9016
MVAGVYRFVRNPMYLAVLTIILGQALLFGSWWLGGRPEPPQQPAAPALQEVNSQRSIRAGIGR